MSWGDTSVLVTGGTGTFGRAFVELLASEREPGRLTVFSRDELKQSEMRQAGAGNGRVKYVLGDVRDLQSVRRAMVGIDVVVHTAALKQVPTCEAQPIEAVLTNSVGAQHVVDAALEAGVDRVIAISTDKAVHPENVYGASKLIAERMFLRANAHSSNRGTKLSCVRYGNVIGSRGSVIPRLLEQRRRGRIELTDERMTRFWIRIDDAVRFVLRCIDDMQGGEVFVPKLRSSSVAALVAAIAPDTSVDVTGIRPGEKLHERLLSDAERACTTVERERYVVKPGTSANGSRLPSGFEYVSSSESVEMTPDEVEELVRELLAS